ncbi:MAG: (Fe-S)-binding protein [bacterium]
MEKDEFSEIDKRKPLNALPIDHYLPALSCASCGFPTCMAFTFKLLSVEVTVDRCLPLFEDGKISQKDGSSSALAQICRF